LYIYLREIRSKERSSARAVAGITKRSGAMSGGTGTGTMKRFSLEELKKHNGKQSPSIYVAHQGRVFDVSSSRYWKTGVHMRRHEAGADLTEEIKGAPHGDEVFQRVTQVGVLLPEKDPADAHLPGFLVKLFEKVPMLRRHPHPMTVHFPLAFGVTIPLFNVLYLATGAPCIDTVAFSLLALTLAAAPVAMLTGPYAWWVNYGGRWTRYIRIKLSVSGVLLVLLIVAFIWRTTEPGILSQPTGLRMLYLLLSFLFPPLVGILGWVGAKMTFPH